MAEPSRKLKKINELDIDTAKLAYQLLLLKFQTDRKTMNTIKAMQTEVDSYENSVHSYNQLEYHMFVVNCPELDSCLIPFECPVQFSYKMMTIRDLLEINPETERRDHIFPIVKGYSNGRDVIFAMITEPEKSAMVSCLSWSYIESAYTNKEKSKTEYNNLLQKLRNSNIYV